MRVGYRRWRTVVVGLDSSDRRAIDDVPRLPSGPSGSTPSACRPASGGLEPRCRRASGWRARAGRPPSRQPGAPRRPARGLQESGSSSWREAPGGSSSTPEVAPRVPSSTTESAVAADARRGGGRTQWLPARHVGGSVPQVRPVKGHIVRLRGGHAPPPLAHGAGPRAGTGVLPGAALGRVARHWRHQRGARVRRQRPGGPGLRPSRRRTPSRPGPRRACIRRGHLRLPAGHAGQRPLCRVTTTSGWQSPPATTATASCSRRSPLLPRRALRRRGSPLPMGHFGAERGSHLALGAERSARRAMTEAGRW